MLHRLTIIPFLLLMLFGAGLTAQYGGDILLVAWVDGGDLWLWRGDEPTPREIASGDVLIPYLSPAGRHIAYTQQPDSRVGSFFLARSLSVVSADGANERQLVDIMALTANEGVEILIGNVQWLNERAMLFNTVQWLTLPLAPLWRSDLWQVDIETGDIEQILEVGTGGRFSISPDGQHIAVVDSGRFEEAQGRIFLLVAQGRETRELLTFDAVSSASSQPFYPEIFWEADSSALRVAIPDKNLVYDDVNGEPTVLWRLSIDGTQERLGAVRASIVGQPIWSADGERLTYARRIGQPTNNTFELVIAAGDGDKPEVYAEGRIGEFGSRRWIAGRTQFAYGEGGLLWLGESGEEPLRLTNTGAATFFPVFTSGALYVFATEFTSPFDLHYANLDALDDPPILIASVDDDDARLALFDAIALPAEEQP